MQREGAVRCDAEGVIVVTQEDRFRLQTPDGRSLLFVLGDGIGVEKVASLAAGRRPVAVCYRGEPEAGAVATRVEPVAKR